MKKYINASGDSGWWKTNISFLLLGSEVTATKPAIKDGDRRKAVVK